MYRTTQRIRKAGVAALVAATALSGLASLAPPAGAITGGSTLAAASSTSAGIGKTGQAAGNWTLTPATPTNMWASGEQVTVTIDDNNVDANCSGTTDTLGFSSLPTVTNSGTAAFVATIESSGLCTALGVKNVLRLNFTGAGTGTFTISGVKYDVGAGVNSGAVTVTAADSDTTTITTGAASNAFLTTALLTANNPPKGAANGGAGSSYAISPIVIAEQTAAAANGDLCIVFDADIPATPTPAPTVAVSGGSDTATLTVDTTPSGADSILVTVTDSTPASASTFTISGIQMDTSSTGFINATLYDGTCGGTALSTLTPVGYVGNVARFGGSDRFVTAQILLENGFGCGAATDNVVIARGDLFPDALAASYLAGKLGTGTGILLTNSDSVPAATLNALRDRGVNNVYLVGGTTAISAAVATQLDGTTAYQCSGAPEPGPTTPPPTLTVQRIGGADRYETAKLIAEFPGLGSAGTLDLNGAATPGAAKTAIVASGENFPDALAGGPLANNGAVSNGVGSLPLLLSGQAAVPATTLGALGDLGIVNVVVLGGTAAVSDAAVAQLTAAGYNVRRIAGATRQATAATLATALITEWGFSGVNVVLARGDNFPDALAGGPWAGRGASGQQPILLTGTATSLSADTGAFLASRPLVTNLNIFGGTAAVSAGVVQEALNAASQ